VRPNPARHADSGRPGDVVGRAEPPAAQGGRAPGRPVADRRGCRVGQDSGAHQSVAYLLAERGARPGEILAITFTNKAAGEMKERVAALVGPRARSMWVSTFHSMCVRILRADHSSLGLKSSFSIYDAEDSTG